MEKWANHIGVSWLKWRGFPTSKGFFTPDIYFPEDKCSLTLSDNKEVREAFQKEYPEETLISLKENHLFERAYLYQILFEKRLGNNVKKMKQEERIEYLRNQFLLLYAELAEVLQEVPWKKHKKYTSLTIDKKKFLAEWMDCFIFLMNILIGIDPEMEEVESAFNAVVKKNFTRIKEGYSGPPGEDLLGQEKWNSLVMREMG